MKSCFYSFLVLFINACNSTKKNFNNVDQESVTVKQGTFNFIAYTDSFTLLILSFIKNDVYCFTEGIPYALIIGHPINSDVLPDSISVLARCDNNTYLIGEKLKIVSVENPEILTLHKISFTKDTLINDKTISWEIGSEFRAIWGQVLQRSL